MLYNFTPSNNAPYQFQPTLDGATYTAIVTWGLAGQRFYINLYDLSGNIVFALPVIGSPVGIDIEQAFWQNSSVFINTTVPHGYTLGSTIPLTINEMTPDGYNGTVQAFITGRNTFSYPLSSDPGPATALGMASYNVNIAAGYFASTLVYRTANTQFEVTP